MCVCAFAFACLRLRVCVCVFAFAFAFACLCLRVCVCIPFHDLCLFVLSHIVELALSCILSCNRAAQIDLFPRNVLRVTEHGLSPFLACRDIFAHLQQQQQQQQQQRQKGATGLLVVYSDSNPGACRTPALHKEMQRLLDGLNHVLDKVAL